MTALASFHASVVTAETPRVVRALIFPMVSLPGEADSSQGEMPNLEHLILQNFAEAHGFELEIVWVRDFSKLLDRLEAGEGDIAGASLTITEERLQRFDFSESYFPTLSILMERRGEEASDLSGLTIATLADSSTATLVQEIPGVEIIGTASPEESLQTLASGKADAAATDTLVYLWLSPIFPNLIPTRLLDERTFCGFALRKNDSLKPLLDEHLRSLKKSGELRELISQAYGNGLEAVEEMTLGLFAEED